MKAALRSLPSVDRVLATPDVQTLLAAYSRASVVGAVRREIDAARDAVLQGEDAPDATSIAHRVVNRAKATWAAFPHPVINATGVVLHTNLGRAPLSRDAIDAIRAAAAYTDLELSVESGTRGQRGRVASELLAGLTGAEAGHVATNNAAALLLTLAATSRGRQVIVSRGQAVEIGGGFRIPTIMRQSGARLLEVGTTNRTTVADYHEAIGPRTGAILHVHRSNFRVVGFTEEPSVAELADLAHRHDLPLIVDNGSGSLLDTERFGLGHEPMPAEAVAAGADLVAFSGDKLLGGPQAGLVVGRAPMVERIATHPLARAVRPDKLILAALTATLVAYVRGDAERTLPLWQMIGQTAADLEARAEVWQGMADARGVRVDLEEGRSTVGGGSLPDETLPTTLLVLPRSLTAGALRRFSPPVIARTGGGRVRLDLRTVPSEAEITLLDAVCAAASNPGATPRP